jgi:hypothetical protein
MDVALSLQKKQPITNASEELLQTVAELGVELKPINPGMDDPHLAPYFTVDVPDIAIAEQVIAQLQHCKEIEAAYLKPQDEMPE